MADVTIGPPADTAELDAFGRVVAQSLLFPRVPEPRTPEADWVEREGRDTFRLARIGGRVVGGLTVQRMGQWFGGRPVPTGGVRAVAVLPEARALGVAGKLLLATFNELREAGVPLSTLYPATQLVYRRAGYESGGARTCYRIATTELRSGAADRALAMTRLEGPHQAIRARIEPAYRERARRSAGNLERNDWLWHRLLEPLLPPETYVYAVEGPAGLEGHIVYSQERIQGSLRAEMRVRELVALTAPALRRILAFFADHRSIVQSVQWQGATSDPIPAALDNPAVKIDERWDWMVRIVAVEAALAARGYGPGRSVEVDFAVLDGLLPWNQGSFVLRVEKGRGHVTRGGSGSVVIDIRGLAALYTGYAGARELRALGLIDGSDSDLERLETAFAGPAPWMPDMF